jgi:hypothetical protein
MGPLARGPGVREGDQVTKTRTDLFPWREIPIIPGITLDHIDLLVTSWWLRSSPNDTLTVAIPPELLLPVCEVLTYGAVKYPDLDGRAWEVEPRYQSASYHFAAFKRHLYDPRTHDLESGLPARDHAVTRACMLSVLSQRGLLIDDRPARVERVGEADVEVTYVDPEAN